MSILMNYSDQRFIEIAQVIFEEQFRRDPKLERELDERRKKLMYDDVIYNISFLLTSIYFKDSKIFEGYARWIYDLLCNLMKDLDRDRIMEHMVDHYNIMAEILSTSAGDILSEEEIALAVEFLNIAAETTRNAVTDIQLSETFMDGEHYEIRRSYLDAILKNQTREAYKIIDDAKEDGLDILEIYEKILTKVMYEVGLLWHKNIITVDKEHYATSVTQTVMSSFYGELFDRPRRNRVLLSCAVGSELHEMGIRMLSDMFEYNRWDTYYLGAALPKKAILDALNEHKPDLIALSVTMPPYLSTCEDIIKSIRESNPQVKIAVGGQAFKNTDKLWEKWDVDFYSESSHDLIEWAKENIVKI